MNAAHELAEIVPALESERTGAKGNTESSAPNIPHRFVRGGDFVFDVPDTPQSIWGEGEESLWQSGESLMIVAPVGVGKTTIAGQLVKERIGLGSGSFLGYPVQATEGRVLYIAADRPKQIARSFRRMLSESDREAVNERLEFWEGPLPFDLAKDPAQLVKFVQSRGATEIWIDSVKDVALDLSKDETGSRFNNAVQTCIAEGIEVAMLHHQRKAGTGNPKPKSLDDVYGSTWIPAGAGSVVLLWGAAGDPVVELSHLKPPAESVGPLQVLHDFTHGKTRLHETMDAYQLLEMEGKLTAQALAVLLFGSDSKANEVEKARRKLNHLVQRGKATKQDGFGKEPAVYLHVAGGAL